MENFNGQVGKNITRRIELEMMEINIAKVMVGTCIAYQRRKQLRHWPLNFS